MPVLEDLKEYAERATGPKRPGKPNVSIFALLSGAQAPHAWGSCRAAVAQLSLVHG
jgi:hypothetical protein